MARESLGSSLLRNDKVSRRWKSGRLGRWGLLAGLLAAGTLGAAPLPKPSDLVVEEGAVPRIRWKPVEGAALYRVAVFDQPDAEGKRPLLAAVWVAGESWLYGKGAVVAKAGALASTHPLPLPAGRLLRVMVAAAAADGADKSEWVGVDFRVPASSPGATPTFTPTATPEAGGSGSFAVAEQDAELELEGGEEFHSAPDPVVLEVEEGAAGASGAVASAATGALAASAAESSPAGATVNAVSLAQAQALLKAGRFEEAETQFRALLKEDEKDADAWEGLGDSLAARRMKAEAHEAYQRALKLDGRRRHLREWIEKNVPRK